MIGKDHMDALAECLVKATFAANCVEALTSQEMDAVTRDVACQFAADIAKEIHNAVGLICAGEPQLFASLFRMTTKPGARMVFAKQLVDEARATFGDEAADQLAKTLIQ